MDVLQLFTIAGEASPDRARIAQGFIAIKTWNEERAARTYRPGTLLHENPDNADLAGPDSVYDRYV